jgi:hypothetical protein
MYIHRHQDCNGGIRETHFGSDPLLNVGSLPTKQVRFPLSHRVARRASTSISPDTYDGINELRASLIIGVDMTGSYL